jgi:hypothetical protein
MAPSPLVLRYRSARLAARRFGLAGLCAASSNRFRPSRDQGAGAHGAENQAKYFEQALDDLQNRIKEVESSAEGSKTK